jgi:hypothetical protein
MAERLPPTPRSATWIDRLVIALAGVAVIAGAVFLLVVAWPAARTLLAFCPAILLLTAAGIWILRIAVRGHREETDPAANVVWETVFWLVDIVLWFV